LVSFKLRDSSWCVDSIILTNIVILYLYCVCMTTYRCLQRLSSSNWMSLHTDLDVRWTAVGDDPSQSVKLRNARWTVGGQGQQVDPTKRVPDPSTWHRY
jgi:hypothetical protein